MAEALLFAAIAGYADAVAYLRFKAFAGMMTGNTVFLGIATFRPADLPAAEYASIIALFFLAACASFAVLRFKRMAPVVLVVEAAMLALAGVGAGWAVIPLVIAMGVQNPLVHRLGISINTTFVTGDLVRFAQGIVHRLWPPPSAEPAAAAAGIQPAQPLPFMATPQPLGSIAAGLTWFAYLLGAGAGTVGSAHLGWPLLIPVLALLFLFRRVARS